MLHQNCRKIKLFSFAGHYIFESFMSFIKKKALVSNIDSDVICSKKSNKLKLTLM
jgi:hypothetical protein